MPLLARIYPNGRADVNHFHAAGGIAFLVRTLLDAGLLHDDVLTVAGAGCGATPPSRGCDGDELTVARRPHESLDHLGPAPGDDPFAPDGGLQAADGQLSAARDQDLGGEARAPGRSRRRPSSSATRTSSSPRSRRASSTRDLVAVIRFQGPRNGMPELHKLTPALGVLQDRGQRVAIVTDGRMSGASGKVPAAIHVTPEAALGGPLSRVQDGDEITVDALAGTLDLQVDRAELHERPATGRAPQGPEWTGTGRELFAAFRATVGSADTGASVFPGVPVPPQEVSLSPSEWSPSDAVPGLLDRVPVVPVVVVDDLAHAVPVARRWWRAVCPSSS